MSSQGLAKHPTDVTGLPANAWCCEWPAVLVNGISAHTADPKGKLALTLPALALLIEADDTCSSQAGCACVVLAGIVDAHILVLELLPLVVQ
eukprot:1157540-Pelagomonas_calceolata.AAC.1